MKGSVFGLLLVAAMLAWTAPANAQCSTHNTYSTGWNFYYDHIVNGYGTSLNCWTYGSLGTVSITSGSCGLSSTQGFTYSGYAATMTQSFTVSSSDAYAGSAVLSYELDFDDPHNDSGGNWIDVLVYADNSLVAFDTYDGGDPDINCTPRSINLSASAIEGKSVSVTFQARTSYSDVLIRTRGLALWQDD
jgi:hypothetical protein